ncbi:MAG: DUF2933 domain-containing protein [Mycobacteriales bacterium]
MTLMKLCFDRRVVIALTVVGVGALAFSPALAVSLLPLLIVAVCPLSMLFMMRGMSSGGHCTTGTGPGAEDKQLSQQATSDVQAELRELKEQQAAELAGRSRA